MSEEQIAFFYEDTPFVLEQKEEVSHWIESIAKKHDFEIKEVNYIFCSDEYLHKINVEYLDHDTYTDIITFDNSESSNTLESDIFISVDRVKENAEKFQVSFQDELHRVMIHGILHLVGLKDKSEEDAQKMRLAEQESLSLRSF